MRLSAFCCFVALTKTFASEFNSSTHPQVVWLLSFPNSGTTYTLQAAREASIPIAANTCLKWVHADCLSIGESHQGPYWISNLTSSTTNHSTVLTRTHCAGHYPYCGQISSSKFSKACRQTAKIEKWGWKSCSNEYHTVPSKGIHLWRDPLDNIVARWRHAKRHVWIPSFRTYCKILDWFYWLVHGKRGQQRFICFSEFNRYLQWHHHALTMEATTNMNVLHVHYEEYGDNGETLSMVLEFLGGTSPPPSDPQMKFVANKTYSHLYTGPERLAIQQFFRENAQPAVWEHLQRYLK